MSRHSRPGIAGVGHLENPPLDGAPVLQQLPMEFAVEAQKLLGISLEGSVG